MSLTLLAFLLIYTALAVACLTRHPVFGVIGYYMSYILSPAGRWWGVSLAQMGFRYNLFMAIIAFVGLILHYRHLKPGKGVSKQEVLLWLFVGTVWLAGFMNSPPAGSENHAVKLAKITLMIIVLRLTADDLRKFKWVIWGLLLSTAYGAFDTRFMADRIGSRISEGSGGSDFSEGNFLAAHLVAMLPFLAVLFVQGRWKVKVFLATTAAVIVDVIVQCRSRGAMLAIAVGGIMAFLFAPHGMRKKLYPMIIIGALGAVMLMDPGYWSRMSEIKFSTSIEEQDASSAGRLLAWKAALSMASDHPLGVGYNNFANRITDYIPSMSGRDAHNTYLRCLAELGIQGALLLAVLMAIALGQSYRLMRMRRSDDPDFKTFTLMGYATGTALVVYLVAGMFVSLTYIEDFYLIMMLPGILARYYIPAGIDSNPSSLAEHSSAQVAV